MRILDACHLALNREGVREGASDGPVVSAGCLLLLPHVSPTESLHSPTPCCLFPREGCACPEPGVSWVRSLPLLLLAALYSRASSPPCVFRICRYPDQGRLLQSAARSVHSLPGKWPRLSRASVPCTYRWGAGAGGIYLEGRSQLLRTAWSSKTPGAVRGTWVKPVR